MSDDLIRQFMSVFFVWSYKLATLAVGCFFAKLGYTLFIKGVTGEFTFHVEAKGAKADLISASPGVFLMLMGTIIVAIGLYKGLSIDLSRTPPSRAVEATEPQLPQRPGKPDLPRIPPPSEGRP